jgi:hypothetical protein
MPSGPQRASAVDVMRRAGTPMTAREIADKMVADKLQMTVSRP